jgi:hypothetical protein
MWWLPIGTALLVVVGGATLLALKWPKDRSEELRTLKRLVEERDLDWVDMRSRCKRLLARTEKAAKRLEPELESTPAIPTNGEGARSISGRALSPHQMEVQQMILRKRAGG